MESDDNIQASRVASFGPFRLSISGRLLVRDQTPVDIGGRALEILIALIGRAGEIISKRELMELVWPKVIVDEASLRVHVAALRKILGDGKDGARYIINVPGRGYGFVGSVEPLSCPFNATIVSPARSNRPQSLPAPPQLLFGRKQTVTALCCQLLSRRFLSIVGPGGIGKTTVALAVAHAVSQDFSEDEMFFVDLGTLTDPALIVRAIASAIGCVADGTETESSIIAFLTGKRVLILLDTCEHVIGTLSAFAEHLFNGLPSAFLLTTSREALRVNGESVHVLKPLDSPLDDKPSAAQALASPAVQLFMESAAASGYEADLSNTDAPTVAGICRRLDGIALAIELVAGRVGNCGIQGAADLVHRGPMLVLQGRRSALPRHQTLQALLDWSFELLSANEKRLFRRLSVFVGQFSMEAARAVAGEAGDELQSVSKAILSLVDKSLIRVTSTSGPIYFRLLDTIGAYASAKHMESGEAEVIARRHACYFAAFLKSETLSQSIEPRNLASYDSHMGNVRKALAWSFSVSGDRLACVESAAHAAPILLHLSLYGECQHWCERALDAMHENNHGTEHELELLEALAISSMWTHGVSEDVRTEIEGGLELAQTSRERRSQFNSLFGLNSLLHRLGDFSAALIAATQSDAIAQSAGRPAKTEVADWMQVAPHRCAGDQAASPSHRERGCQPDFDANPQRAAVFGSEHRTQALVALSRCLSPRGLSDRARKVARQTITGVDPHNEGGVGPVWRTDWRLN